jgi:hypothetical protein
MVGIAVSKDLSPTATYRRQRFLRPSRFLIVILRSAMSNVVNLLTRESRWNFQWKQSAGRRPVDGPGENLVVTMLSQHC